MLKGFGGLPKKQSDRTVKAKGNEARIIDIIKSAIENFPAKIKGLCWVHKYKRVSLGTGNFDGSNLELLTVDVY